MARVGYKGCEGLGWRFRVAGLGLRIWKFRVQGLRVSGFRVII